MSKNNKITLCYPYGMAVTCICDGRGGRGVIYRCFHSLEALQTGDDLTGEAMLSRDDRSDNDLTGGGMDELGLESLGGTFGRGLDERTEIILAATFLVLIILAFISFVIYRCEKNYMRRRLQETFHLSPSAACANGGFFSSLAASSAGHHAGHIPSISVSVQTEPTGMANMNGNATQIPHTTSLIGNGVGLFQNGGGINANPVAGNGGNNYATLPHPHHHHGGGGGGGVHGGLQNLGVVSTEAETITQHWSRDNLLTSNYDVNLTTFASTTNPNSHLGPTRGIHSRENTLSRDVHHITERDLGLRTSCTVENLRSPSVAGTNGRDDDDLNTDYAESDVMLGGGTGTNSNGSNNGNGSPEDRSNNMVASTRY